MPACIIRSIFLETYGQILGSYLAANSRANTNGRIKLVFRTEAVQSEKLLPLFNLD